jgi:hypothetical protein
MESARTLDLQREVPEGLGVLQLDERVDLHHEAGDPCLRQVEGITVLAESDRGRERAICCDREDLER